MDVSNKQCHLQAPDTFLLLILAKLHAEIAAHYIALISFRYTGFLCRHIQIQQICMIVLCVCVCDVCVCVYVMKGR